RGAGDRPAVETREERVGPETVRAVVGVVDLARGEEAGHVGHLPVVDPEPTHRVMHPREDLHGYLPRVVADELLVDLEHAADPSREHLRVEMAHVEGDHRLATRAVAGPEHDLEDSSPRDGARH